VLSCNFRISGTVPRKPGGSPCPLNPLPSCPVPEEKGERIPAPFSLYHHSAGSHTTGGKKRGGGGEKGEGGEKEKVRKVVAPAVAATSGFMFRDHMRM